MSSEDANKAKKKQQSRPDKFQDPVSPVFPPAIQSWRRALEDFDPANGKFVYEANPSDVGYTFPEPAMFIRAKTPQRQEAYFRTWLKYRSAFVYRVSSKDFNAQPVPTSVWRDLLTYEHAYNKQDTSSSNETRDTHSSRLRAQAFDILQNCVEAENVELAGLEKGRVKWNGKVVEILTDAEREEILWELSELNFRFELLALDSRATATTDKDRQELVSACFPGSTSRSLLVADLGTANHGLADGDWEKRAVYLQALKRLMITWPEVPSIIQAEKWQWSDREIEDLEHAVTQFYVWSFYNHFRRAPIIPRGLSHTAALYREPESPKITVLDPCPNMFYDVSVLLPL
jgi:hypothetical protein